MRIDYLIVGQGLCGTLLSRRLMQAGKTVAVIDDGNPGAAGRVAGGIINPVTGKRLVAGWMIDQLLPFAKAEYNAIAAELGTTITNELSILDFHATNDARTTFDKKARTTSEYLQPSETGAQWQDTFRYNYGVGTIKHCLLVDLATLISTWGQHLRHKGHLIQEYFQLGDCVISDTGVQWRDVEVDYLLFCDGATAANNPYFERLPWSKDKGEVLIVSIPGLPRTDIYRQGISIVPWKGELFWVGASHDWKYTTTEPTSEFRNKVTELLDYWLQLPYTIVDHITALRPANFDRKPFVGMHPKHQRVGILNGMGGKGCSMAPWFAAELAGHLLSGASITPDADVRRYEKILSR